jgi:hypothetical protein
MIRERKHSVIRIGTARGAAPSSFFFYWEKKRKSSDTIVVFFPRFLFALFFSAWQAYIQIKLLDLQQSFNSPNSSLIFLLIYVSVPIRVTVRWKNCLPTCVTRMSGLYWTNSTYWTIANKVYLCTGLVQTCLYVVLILLRLPCLPLTREGLYWVTGHRQLMSCTKPPDL